VTLAHIGIILIHLLVVASMTMTSLLPENAVHAVVVVLDTMLTVTLAPTPPATIQIRTTVVAEVIILCNSSSVSSSGSLSLRSAADARDKEMKT
jgi:hypothetical protein